MRNGGGIGRCVQDEDVCVTGWYWAECLGRGCVRDVGVAGRISQQLNH